MKTASNDDIRTAVRQRYGRVAEAEQGGCCDPGCCSGTSADPKAMSLALGYTVDDVGGAPPGANLGLGCGNPQAIAALLSGEKVLDLGSGAGFDSFLAARQVGDTGQVIGVDMTPEMVSKARDNATRGDYRNVEFRLGEIENLPVADSSIDVVISNCVINLSPAKPRVFEEAYRALRPGGRLAISDIVATAPLPADIRGDLALHSGCVAGAATVAEIESMLHEAGFEQVRVAPRDESRPLLQDWAPGTPVADYVVSATIEAVRPVA